MIEMVKFSVDEHILRRPNTTGKWCQLAAIGRLLLAATRAVMKTMKLPGKVLTIKGQGAPACAVT
jgi:hypothetical protein